MKRLCLFALKTLYWSLKLTLLVSVTFIKIAWRRLRPSNLHGSASFANRRTITSLNQGFIALGKASGRLIKSPTGEHILCVAPTGSGKTASLVLPNLLSMDAAASCVVTDPKGECFNLTRNHRESFGPVYHWSPFLKGGHRFNPLDFVRVGSDDEIDDIQLVAELLIPNRAVSDPFWNNEARNLIAGLILFVLYERPKELRTLAEVRAILTADPQDFNATLKRMA